MRDVRDDEDMKLNARAVILVGIVAALIVAFQWAYCYGNDNFSLIQVDGNQYKVFSYGFPFKITDANPITGIGTPPNHLPTRLAGNYITFFIAGIAVMALTRKSRTNGFSVRREARRR